MTKRICCFCQTWESGGIESFLTNILSRIDLAEFEADIVAEQLKPSVFTQRLKSRGIGFYELSGSQNRLGANHRMFRLLLKERRYDVVHLNIFQGMSLEYARISKQLGVPKVIAHSHNSALRSSSTRKIKLLLHRLYAKKYAAAADELWACSSLAAEFMFPEQLLDERGYTFIPNGIDLEKFRFDPEERRRVREELGISDKFVVGNVGRLCYQKNQSFLLDVLAELCKSRPETVLLLVGEGPDRKNLEAKAENLGIADRVIFYGTTDRPQELYWAMDAFAFPSLFEGLGIAAVEAQAAGLPVVCSEFVPAEALISARACSMDIKAWADLVFSAERACAQGLDEFDINSVARLVEEKWKNL